MSNQFSFEKAMGNYSSGSSQGLTQVRELFDLDSNVSLQQVQDMVAYIQVQSAKDGIPIPVPFNTNLIYELIGYDEVLREELRKKQHIFKTSTIGEKRRISEVVVNVGYFKEQGFAPRTVIDGEGCKWSLGT